MKLPSLYGRYQPAWRAMFDLSAGMWICEGGDSILEETETRNTTVGRRTALHMSFPRAIYPTIPQLPRALGGAAHLAPPDIAV